MQIFLLAENRKVFTDYCTLNALTLRHCSIAKVLLSYYKYTTKF